MRITEYGVRAPGRAFIRLGVGLMFPILNFLDEPDSIDPVTRRVFIRFDQVVAQLNDYEVQMPAPLLQHRQRPDIP